MRLHEDKQLFADAINAASRSKSEGGLGIKSIFIEKDYWICRSLKLMADVSLIGAHERQVLTGLINFQVSLGYRFNI